MPIKINTVCYSCGVSANVLTCLKKYGRSPIKLAYTISTYHRGKCQVCECLTDITQTRDFFYPDFGLLFKQMKKVTPPKS